MPLPLRRLTLVVALTLMLVACATPGPSAPTPTEPPATPTEPGQTATAPLPTATDAPEGEGQLDAGQWSRLIFFPPLGQVVMVNGGPDTGKPNTDPLALWRWDGTTWTLLSADPAGPRWRNFASVALDTARNVLVVHGGVQTAGAWLDDTWEWDGAKWTPANPGPGPGQREGAEMAYDAARGQVLLFGGATDASGQAGDTWAWNGQAWAEVSTTGPAARFPNAMVYDAARAQVLLYGGHYVGQGQYLKYGDLWAWDGFSWAELHPSGPNPGYRIVSRLVYDPLDARVLLFGGGDATYLSDMWAWDGQAWAQIANDGAPARTGMSAAYDPVRQVIVAFGGVDRRGGTVLAETWEWDREAWRCVAGCP